MKPTNSSIMLANYPAEHRRIWPNLSQILNAFWKRTLLVPAVLMVCITYLISPALGTGKAANLSPFLPINILPSSITQLSDKKVFAHWHYFPISILLQSTSFSRRRGRPLSSTRRVYTAATSATSNYFRLQLGTNGHVK
jgi:hypothetical protein